MYGESHLGRLVKKKKKKKRKLITLRLIFETLSKSNSLDLEQAKGEWGKMNQWVS